VGNNDLIEEILRPGITVQLEFTNSKGDKIKTKSTVNQLEETQLILDLPKKADVFNQLAPNDVVVVVCKHNDEPHDNVFFTQFVKVTHTDPPLAVLNKPGDVSMGRHSLRYDVQIPFSYFYHDKEYKDGVVENLSSIGLLATIIPNENLKTGIDIPFKIVLPTFTSPLLLVGKIVRLIKIETKYQIAFSFPYIGREFQDQITKYLFSIQKTSLKQDQQQKVAFIKNN
jgi:c-di-GMP-binding flagellar brake protein YcgR